MALARATFEPKHLHPLLEELAATPRPADTSARVEAELRRLRTRDDAIEAARQFMAAFLRLDRRSSFYAVAPELADQCQTLRDCLSAERRARRPR
jgi:hypothetical protein